MPPRPLPALTPPLPGVRWSALLGGLLGMLAATAGPPENLPEDVVRRFYGAIAGQRCEEADGLAVGYSVARCRRIESLEVPEPILRREIGDGRVVVEFSLSFRRRGEPPVATRVAVPLLRHGDSWRVDMTAVQPAGNRPTDAAPTVPVPAAPGATRSLTSPADAAPPATPPVVAMDAVPPAGLVGLWTADQLRGKPGDERINPLRQPDRRPPGPAAPSEALPALPATLAGSLRRVRLPDGRRWVALTFDLCEQADEIAGYDRTVVNTLRARAVPATFFAGGKWLRTHPEQAMQLMADPLFEVGNHAWTHGNLRILTGAKLRDQIVWTQAQYENLWQQLQQRASRRGLDPAMAAIPRQPRLFRFPYGTCSGEALHTVNGLGLAAIQWDVVSGDPGGMAPVPRLVKAIRPGSIVVMHANGRGRGTAAALPRLIDALKARGYEFKTVGDLLAAGTPETVAECYENKPGDNVRYDAIFGEGTERPQRHGAAAGGPGAAR